MLLLTLLPAVAARAESIRAVVTSGDMVRAIQLRRDGGNLLVPLLACGPLLGAEARWVQATNQWSLKGNNVIARGYLDEPLLFIGGQPLLVKSPPRLISGAPFLSLEALQLLGRHGWDTDILWDEAGRKLVIKPAQLQSVDANGPTHALTIPPVPPGARVLALDAGHERHEGAHGMHGMTEGDLGLRLAQAVAATLNAEGVAVVILQDGDEPLEPREVAGLANALPADLFVSFHGSEYGDPGAVVWTWGAANLLGSGIAFEPFEPAGGWAHASAALAGRSNADARRLVHALAAANIPARGPFGLPLNALEGLNCPGVLIDLEGLGTPAGSVLVADDQAVERLAAALAAALRASLAAPTDHAADPATAAPE
jgi:N-acetylmuramoyl-L-alanine amidase